jgi:hypothetical protein
MNRERGPTRGDEKPRACVEANFITGVALPVDGGALVRVG